MNGVQIACLACVETMAYATREVSVQASASATLIGQAQSAINVVIDGKGKTAMYAKRAMQTRPDATSVIGATMGKNVIYVQMDGNLGNTLLIYTQIPYQKTTTDICVTNASQIIGDTTAKNVQLEMTYL